jgi:lysozyme family protein
MGRFEDCMQTVFRWEGGFVDNPYDNGGPTNMGITHAVLARWRGVAGVTPAEVKALTRQEATEIFRSRYWAPIKGDTLPQPLDLVVLDGAVNHGPASSVKMLQRALGLEPSGTMDAATQTALGAAPDTIKICWAVADARRALYQGHEDAAHFIKGWTNRLNDVMATALASSGASWTFAGGGQRDGATPSSVPTPASGSSTSSIPLAIIEDADLQHALIAAGLLAAGTPGQFDADCVAAMDTLLGRHASQISAGWQQWPIARRKLALGQLLCEQVGIDSGRIDGLYGPRTEAAYVRFNEIKLGLPETLWRDILPTSTGGGGTSSWPSEAGVPGFFGELGPECRLVPMKRLQLPFKMKLAWDLETEIDGFKVHERVADSAARAFAAIFAHYGHAGVDSLGLNLFGGCHSCRKKRGGSAWSMHAWSIAIDFDPARNRLEWDHRRARLAQPDAVPFWQCWENEGWTSLGRWQDYDWMHVQATRS